MSTNQELQTTIVSAIVEAHALAGQLREQTEQKAKAAILAACECGAHLIQAKKELAHGKFGKWVGDYCPFDLRTAQNYMRLAVAKAKHDSLLEESGSLRQAYQLAGILPPGAAPSATKRQNDLPYLRPVSSVLQWFNKATETRPLTKWAPDEKATLKRNLEPLAKLYAEL